MLKICALFSLVDIKKRSFLTSCVHHYSNYYYYYYYYCPYCLSSRVINGGGVCVCCVAAAGEELAGVCGGECGEGRLPVSGPGLHLHSGQAAEVQRGSVFRGMPDSKHTDNMCEDTHTTHACLHIYMCVCVCVRACVRASQSIP